MSTASAPVQATADESGRRQTIVDVFETAYGELMRTRADAWRTKFRKMAAGAFPFYRGSAVLFYSDLAHHHDPFLNDRASRVWIQGDLHAENFGTYLDASGRLIFDVNDFDEAYVAPFTWDLRRFSASVALIGYEKALADEEIRQLITTFTESYMAQVKRFATGGDDATFALTLDTAEGVVLDILHSARLLTRVGLLDQDTVIKDHDRRFRRDSKRSELDAATRESLERAYKQYLTTIPKGKRQAVINYRIKDAVAAHGFGIGSAGLRMFSLLLEGPTQTLENDVVVGMKAAQPSAVTMAIKDAAIKNYFLHDGHRTAVSQRALQAYADPWLGYTELDGIGMFVAEVSPYTADLEWDDINHFRELNQLTKDLGRAVAKIHCVSDEDSDQTLVKGSADAAILSSFDGREDAFAKSMTEWAEQYGATVRRDHRLFVDAFRNREFPSLR